VSYELLYHQDVRVHDLHRINRNIQERIRRALENRLALVPEQFGEPLRGTLRGYWKLRVGDYRVVFRVVKKEVWIFGICHRREVYGRVLGRL